MKIFRNKIHEGSPLERKWGGDSVRIERDKNDLHLFINDVFIYVWGSSGDTCSSNAAERVMEHIITQIYNDLDELKYGDEGVELGWGPRQFGSSISNSIYRIKQRYPAQNTYIYKLYINGVIVHMFSSDNENDTAYLINKAKNIRKCCLGFSLADEHSFISFQEDPPEDGVERCFNCNKRMVISFENVRKNSDDFFDFNCPHCGHIYSVSKELVPSSWLRNS